MKFAAHQTFHLKTSWLYKGLMAIDEDPKVLYRESAVEKLGMGKNMVESLRYWLEASRLVVKNDTQMHMGDIASEIFKHDPFFELDGSLQLIHYLLASNEESATTFHWFFNKFSASEFDTESLNIYLSSYISTQLEKGPKETTLSKDINCLLRTYCPEEYDKKNDPETTNPSPFSRFRWIEKNNDKYARRRLNPDEIDPLVFAFALHFFWAFDLLYAESINIEEITEKENAPGLIFGLSLEGCLELIDTIEKNYKGRYLEYNRSGGYFIVNMKKNAKQALREYYRSNQMMAGIYQ